MNDDEYQSREAGRNGHIGGWVVTGDLVQNIKNHTAYLQGQADAAQQRRFEEARRYVPPVKSKPVPPESQLSLDGPNSGFFGRVGEILGVGGGVCLFGFGAVASWNDHQPFLALVAALFCIGGFLGLIGRL